MNLGVRVRMGLTVVSKEFGCPLILKLAPNIPSPCLPVNILPTTGTCLIMSLTK